MSDYNITDFGAIADGKTLNTSAVQAAIDKCHFSGGGTVVFPDGVFVLSTVFLKSNVHIGLSENTLILGSLNFYDYCPDEKVNYPLYQDASHSFFHCSMFVGIDCENISVRGKGKIDMRSVWDEQNVRDMVHRGAKCIALKECKNVEISGITVNNCTDLAIYFAGCENVEVSHINMRTYIDGISPDNSKNVIIRDCDIETGDDGIVFKSSYTLNRLDYCKNIAVNNCKIKSRCNAIKFGTETNGGFYDVSIENCHIYETRITGIAIESVDGAIIDNITVKNIEMVNVNAPIFIHIGKRMRGPKGREIGRISNITLENVTATGKYKPYKIIPWNYNSFKASDNLQNPHRYDGKTYYKEWQMTSNICGLKERPLENIRLKNVYLKLDGGVKEYSKNVPEEAQEYPEVYVYGRILPAKGIYFRHIRELTLDNVKVETYRSDARADFVFVDVKNN
ncbi:MAG: right-handed parallel beta-helix repeat-containing protein [Clostridia bacterium]|nr:right-handed parallel beta-helix repeat-containing protein [Clostridia bacterium]